MFTTHGHWHGADGTHPGLSSVDVMQAGRLEPYSVGYRGAALQLHHTTLCGWDGFSLERVSNNVKHHHFTVHTTLMKV